MKVFKIMLGVLLVAAIAGGSFYGGTLYGEEQAQANGIVPADGTGPWVAAGEGRQGVPGTRGAGGGQDGAVREGGMLAGEIVSIDDGSVTIQDAGGQQVQIHVTDTTLIQKQAEVAVTELQEGDTVFVSGSQGDDGSYTARLVQVSPGGMGMPGGLPFGGQPGAAPDATNP